MQKMRGKTGKSTPKHPVWCEINTPFTFGSVSNISTATAFVGKIMGRNTEIECRLVKSSNGG